MHLTKTTRAALAFVLAGPALLAPAFSSARLFAQTPSGQVSAPLGLDLSAAQRAKADARQAQFKKELAAISADTKLSNDQKQAKALTLYQALDKDMLAILTPAERTKVMKQRQINTQFQADVRALQVNKTLTDAQKQARYIQITQNARTASLALLTPAERTAVLKRNAAAEHAQSLSRQLIKSETPAQSQKLGEIAQTTKSSMQAVIADKTLTAVQQTAKIDALRKDALSSDMALLTPSQRALYARLQALLPAQTQRR